MQSFVAINNYPRQQWRRHRGKGRTKQFVLRLLFVILVGRKLKTDGYNVFYRSGKGHPNKNLEKIAEHTSVLCVCQ
jgi:hypothetical protein